MDRFLKNPNPDRARRSQNAGADQQTAEIAAAVIAAATPVVHMPELNLAPADVAMLIA